jgi:RNA polymerase sigma factor (sigma-70 family)
VRSSAPMDDAEPEGFCTRMLPRLVGSLVLYCGDRPLAEELAQEALARAVEHWGRVGTMASPEAWTYRTAFNLARSSFRRTAAERRAHRKLGRPAPLPDTVDAIAVRDAVRALPPRQRAVIVTRFYLGCDVAETARILGCRPGTVKAHTFKALANLRAAGLADVDPDEDNDDEDNDNEEKIDDTTR